MLRLAVPFTVDNMLREAVVVVVVAAAVVVVPVSLAMDAASH